MKTLAIILSLACCSCSKEDPSQSEGNEPMMSSDETQSSEYPDVVQRVLPLFSRIGVDTNPQDFYAIMDESGVVLEDSDFIDGGGNLGESWEVASLTDEWILHIDYASLEPRAIWRARIYKEVEGRDDVLAFPYFYKGCIVRKNTKK